MWQCATQIFFLLYENNCVSHFITDIFNKFQIKIIFVFLV